MNFLTVTKQKLQNIKSSPINEQNLPEKINQLKELKLLTLQFSTLPPCDSPPNIEEFEIVREVLELEMLISCEAHNEKAFEMAYLQIKPFYYDYLNILKKQSDKFLYFVGLYLLYLLSNNRTTDFSTEIELLNTNARDNDYIKVSLEIERCIMEGNYSKMASIKNSNDKYFNYYLGKFDNAIRYQIARSMEKSYKYLLIKDAMKLLMINDLNALNTFIKEQNNNNQIYWKLNEEKIDFIPVNQEKETIPALRIMNDALFLGTETEKII